MNRTRSRDDLFDLLHCHNNNGHHDLKRSGCDQMDDDVYCYHSVITQQHDVSKMSSSSSCRLRRKSCDCDRLRLMEKTELAETLECSYHSSVLRYLRIFTPWIISLLKERWKYALALINLIMALIICVSNFIVIKTCYLFRPIADVLYNWRNHKTGSNKQNNLRWHRSTITKTNHRRPPAISLYYCPLLLQWLYYLLVLNYFISLPKLLPLAEACSSRPAPKPRPPRPIWTPDLPNAVRENCTEDYAELFCMNSGVCFRTKVLDQYAYGCDCPFNYYGRRCEYEDIGPRVHMSQQQRVETASISSAVSVLVILLVVITMILIVYQRRRKIKASGQSFSASAFEEPAHRSENILTVRPFSIRRPDDGQHRISRNEEV